MIVQLKDWQQKDFYRLGVHGGFDLSFLYDASSNLLDFYGNPVEATSIASTDAGIILGANYCITKHLQVVARYNRSLVKFYKSPDVNTGGMLNYQWSLRLEYLF